jgi:hypothetical protein
MKSGTYLPGEQRIYSKYMNQILEHIDRLARFDETGYMYICDMSTASTRCKGHSSPGCTQETDWDLEGNIMQA